MTPRVTPFADTFPRSQFGFGVRASAGPASGKSAARKTSHTPPPEGGTPNEAAIAQIDALAPAARELRRVRAEALPKLKGGLRARYRILELPGANSLKDAQTALDAAVLAAYGFSAQKDLLPQLLALTQQVAAKIESGESVRPLGVPPGYPEPQSLITADCIRSAIP